MALEVIMPALGLAQEMGRLLRWAKEEGDNVVQGDVLMEIETDKSEVEIEAAGSGVLKGIRVQPGEDVEVGTVMAWILAPGEELPKPKDLVPDVTPEPPGVAPSEVSPPEPAPEQAAVANPQEDVGKGEAPALAAASPLARKIARERQVELVPGGGSGPGGAYLAGDLAPATQSGPGMSASRRRIALHTTQVWTTTPHFYLGRDVRAKRLQNWLGALRQRTGEAVTYTDLLLRTVGAAIRESPQMSDYWSDGEIRHRDGALVGIAIATSSGLLLATMRDPDRLRLPALVAARRQMVERAQAGKLSGSDVEPASITISNLGMFGVDRFEAVLTEGQSSLLAVGRIRDEVVPRDGVPAVEPVLSLTLSCDHRVLDGAAAAPFLTSLVSYLEEPALLLDAEVG